MRKKMEKMKKIRHLALLSLGLILNGAAPASLAESTEGFTLQNEHWEVLVEPRWGGRAGSMVSLKDRYDFVETWGQPKTNRAGELRREGGVFRSMMSGAYHSSQPEEPYAVLETSPTEILLQYENTHLLLDGLREERRIALDGPRAVFAVKVTNTTQEPRMMYYRVQDYIGVGLGQGKDSVYVVAQDRGMPVAFESSPGTPIGRHFVNPVDNWYALADLVHDRGLLVSVTKSPAANIYFWRSGRNPALRTAEIFFPHATLQPGQSWEMEVAYTRFTPSSPATGDMCMDAALSQERIEGYLARAEGLMQLAEPPFQAVMELPCTAAPLLLTPVHPASTALGRPAAPSYGKTLRKIRLCGTPGEVVSFAVAATAADGIAGGAVTFGDLTGGTQGTISRSAFEPKYVAGESQILVNDWNLARNIPYDRISYINNDVVDVNAITPFVLERGETAYIWTNLRIPEDAVAGDYLGTCTIGTGGSEGVEFEIALKVRSFRLIRAEHKTYGTFFPYYIKPQTGFPDGKENPHAITREEYFEVMKVFRDIGFRSFVIYVSATEDLLWVLDRCVELGMTGDHVLISPHAIVPADLQDRGLTAYGWTVDEPGSYRRAQGAITRYETVLKQGFAPTFTPNVPYGLLLTDQLEKMTPIINCNGNAPYLMAATQRYKEQGRKVFWYECDEIGRQTYPVAKRALRGIYLWKTPVDGIYDWDNGSANTNLNNNTMAGFAGVKVLARVGMENIRQGLTDLDYLHTLDTLAGQSEDQTARAEAERVMDWIRQRFNEDYHTVLASIAAPQYLDDIRQKVAEAIEALVAAESRFEARGDSQ